MNSIIFGTPKALCNLALNIFSDLIFCSHTLYTLHSRVPVFTTDWTNLELFIFLSVTHTFFLPKTCLPFFLLVKMFAFFMAKPSINLPWPPTAHLLLPISSFCWTRFNTSTLSSYRRAWEIIGPLSASPKRQAPRVGQACCVLCLCRECLAQCPAHLSKALPNIHFSSSFGVLLQTQF